MAWCGAALLIAYFHESFARRFFFRLFVRSFVCLFLHFHFHFLLKLDRMLPHLFRVNAKNVLKIAFIYIYRFFFRSLAFFYRCFVFSSVNRMRASSLADYFCIAFVFFSV